MHSFLRRNLSRITSRARESRDRETSHKILPYSNAKINNYSGLRIRFEAFLDAAARGQNF